MIRRNPVPAPWWRRAGGYAFAQGWRLGLLPGFLGAPLGRAAGTLTLALRRKPLRRALLHLSRAFPDWPEGRRREVARAAASHLGEAWTAWARLPQEAPEARMERFDVSALEEPVRSALEARTGAVILTAQLGHWEGLAAALAAATGEVMMVARRANTQAARNTVDRLRIGCGVRSCSFSSARIDAARWLKLNRLVLIVADSDGGRDGMFLPYFGLQASVPSLAVRLSADTGAPCLAAFCVRDSRGRYRAGAAPIAVPRWASPEAQREALACWINLLEEAVRRNPGQYLWPQRRWRTRPPREIASVQTGTLIVLPEAGREEA